MSSSNAQGYRVSGRQSRNRRRALARRGLRKSGLFETLEDRRVLAVFWTESFENAAPNYDSGGSGITIDDGTPFGTSGTNGLWNAVSSRGRRIRWGWQFNHRVGRSRIWV